MKPSTKPRAANDTEAGNVYDRTAVYEGREGDITGADLRRVERLPEELQPGVERLFAIIDAGAFEQSPKSLKLLRQIVGLVTKEPPTDNARRVRMLEEIAPRKWDAGYRGTQIQLARIDPAFRKLTRQAFEECSRQNPKAHRFAAALSCKVGAFGDRDPAKAFKPFERAAQQASRNVDAFGNRAPANPAKATRKAARKL